MDSDLSQSEFYGGPCSLSFTNFLSIMALLLGSFSCLLWWNYGTLLLFGVIFMGNPSLLIMHLADSFLSHLCVGHPSVCNVPGWHPKAPGPVGDRKYQKKEL